jgi:hypothetical protein
LRKKITIHNFWLSELGTEIELEQTLNKGK